ncbi:alpha/beta hydrolase [Kaistia nematophila]|uniref:Alpha/beta hydrolase family protein n=1 Tax=Kaistia nematophila TaxID=2994654 RepID=A0A9X3E3L5_9HYPH|nr:alpha/beta hydrolase family protein [Kaistia nematophila]MCX5569173.1 alpha/beta hydrolase family protein [Kaistia nematophila]
MPQRMFAVLCRSLLCGAGMIGAAQAHGIVERHLTAPSAALGHAIPYSLYKPAAEPAAGTRWPVLYLLHGGGGGDQDWLDYGKIAATLDDEIAAGKMPPLVVVMPDGGGESWFVDNTDPGGAGKVETALSTDLVEAIDTTLPTAACRSGRAVGGLSMGGYGATLFALDHPDRFVAAISLSGAIAQPIDPDDAVRIKRGDEYYDGAFGKPFDVERYNAANVFPRVDKDADLPDKPSFWITAGDRDGLGIITGSAELHVALRRAGYDTTLRIGAGQHDWTNWAQSIVPALDWLAPQLRDSCPPMRSTAAAGPALGQSEPKGGEAQK